MSLKFSARLGTALTVPAILLLAGPAVRSAPGAPAPAGPKARYVMDATTMSGLPGMGGGMGGGKPDSGAMMRMMMGGGGANSVTRTLLLRLGSTLAPSAGTPAADHLPDPALRMGDALPLVTPVRTPGSESETFERPKGRLLIFWGCGAHAGPGQPVVIDFAKVAAGQIPPGLFSARAPIERIVTLANSRTYGEWPNGRTAKQVPPGASLIGLQRVEGNYSPPMKFTTTQDFMPGLRTRSADAADGATDVNWGAIAGATGYYANVIGAKETRGGGGDIVWWSSSATREFGGGLNDFLSPATVRRLVTDKVVMPPTQTSCTIPAEVKQAAGESMIGMLNAFGPEESFAFPPRPADPKIAWRPEWTALVRHRSTTTFFFGEMAAAMNGMGDESAGDDEDSPRPKQKPKNKACKPSLGGALSGMLGGKPC